MHFPDRRSHQVFLEPEGWFTDEYYVQGMYTSLPDEIQLAVLRTIPGLEQVRIIRSGYGIEYDALVPSQLDASLQTKGIKGFFTAGQINGTSGYEAVSYTHLDVYKRQAAWNCILLTPGNLSGKTKPAMT